MFSTIGQARRSCVYARTLSPFKGSECCKIELKRMILFVQCMQMRYPKHHTIMSRQIEAEVTILRSVEDPMHSPRFSILASSPDAKMYEFHLEIPEFFPN